MILLFKLSPGPSDNGYRIYRHKYGSSTSDIARYVSQSEMVCQQSDNGKFVIVKDAICNDLIYTELTDEEAMLWLINAISI